MSTLDETNVDDIAARHDLPPEQVRAIVAAVVPRVVAKARERAEQEDGDRSRKGKFLGISYSYKPSKLRKALGAVDLLGPLFGVRL